jgi:hypothetical protein
MKSWGFNLINYTSGGDGCTFSNQTSFKNGQGSKIVFGYNSIYEKVYEFESSKKASSHFNLNRGSISAGCCYNNRTKTVVGFAWFYKNDIKLLSENEIKKQIDSKFLSNKKANLGSFKKGISLRSKKVLMFDLNSKFIRSFNSAKEAGSYIGVTGGAIQFACIKSKKSICKNYKWKYEDTNNGSHEIW